MVRKEMDDSVNGDTIVNSSWDQFEDLDDIVSSSPKNEKVIFDSLPPQLHPAVSLGMRRASSAYWSIRSEEDTTSKARNANASFTDLLSLWDEHSRDEDGSSRIHVNGTTYHLCEQETRQETEVPEGSSSAADGVLYHDILMNVFTFLDARDLAAFSETARRPNFECFYFLQLQLQRALLPRKHVDASENEYPLAGLGCISRLAENDATTAEEIVQEFVESNATLRHLPLSHSLVYLRAMLRSARFGIEGSAGEGWPQTRRQQSQALASVALLVTFLGGAASMMSSGDIPQIEFPAELPNMLFKVGFFGSLMGAAQKRLNVSGTTMRERAENMATEFRSQLQDGTFLGQMAKTLETVSRANSREEVGLKDPQTPNPYEHLPPTPTTTDQDTCKSTEGELNNDENSNSPARRCPTGCVGAYSRAVHLASSSLVQRLLLDRREKFNGLVAPVREEISSTLIDVCSSDDNLEQVIDLVRNQGAVDVEGFYVGTDGTETCALHAAAFHGSAKIVDFLCRGIDENCPEKDGGCCNINIQDAHGWTAAHFAAGANSCDVVRVLASHGAKLSVEATNGYTPLQWAVRLQNKEVAEELRKLAVAETGWISRQPLTAIASRFFAMIPSH